MKANIHKMVLVHAGFLALATALRAAEPSLVPDTPSTAPYSFCTWSRVVARI